MRIKSSHWPLASLSLLSFSLTLPPGANADSLGRNAWVPEAMTVRLEDSALQIISDGFESFADEALTDMLLGLRNVKIYDQGCFLNYTAYIDHVDNVRFDYPSLQIDARSNNRLAVNFDITNFRMDFLLDGDGAFCADHYTCNSTITANRITASADARLDVVNNHIQTRVISANANLNGYEYDTESDCFIIEIIADILQSTVEAGIEGLIESYLTEDLPLFVDDAFLMLEFDTEFDIFGETALLLGQPASVAINGRGATLGERGRISGSTDPCGRPFNRFRYTPGNAPTYPATVPEVGGPYDFAASIGDDILNQFLYVGYDSGALCIVLDQDAEENYGISWGLTTTDLKIVLPELYAIAPDAPVRIDMLPRMAPVVAIGQGDGVVEGQLEAFLLDTELRLYVGMNNKWELALVAGVAADAEFLVRVRSDGQLRILMSDLFNLEINIEDEPLVDLNDTLVERVIPHFLQIIVPSFFRMLNSISFPSFLGYDLTPLAILADGPSRDYLSIYGTLKPTAP